MDPIANLYLPFSAFPHHSVDDIETTCARHCLGLPLHLTLIAQITAHVIFMGKRPDPASEPDGVRKVVLPSKL